MSQVHTLQMGRLIAAGSKSELGKAIDVLASLEALHIVDYDDSEEGFSMGLPGSRSEEVGRDLVKARAARSVVNASPPSRPLKADEIRSRLDGGLQREIDQALELSSKISDLDSEIDSLVEQEDSLAKLEPLGVDLDLLSGYDSLVAHVGMVDDVSAAREVSSSGIIIESRKQDGMVAIFLRNDDSEQTESLLDSAGFQQTPIPSGSGSVTKLLSEIKSKKEEALIEKGGFESKLDSWSQSYGEILVCGLEVLERDHELLTAPVRVAVSDHAFVIDGWVEMRRAEEVESALSDCCLHIETTAFEMEAGAEDMDTQTTITPNKCLPSHIKRGVLPGRWSYSLMQLEDRLTEG